MRKIKCKSTKEKEGGKKKLMKQKLGKSKEERKMRNTEKSNQGITLIALVITIIVLLILAGVTIAMLSGENGILSRATETRFQNDYFTAEEQARLAYMTVKTEIMANRASDGTYDATNATNAEKLRKLVESDLTGTGWSTPTYDSTEKAIKVTYTNTSIKKDGISEGKPANNGKVEFEIGLTEKEAVLKVDGVEVGGGTDTSDTKDEDDSTKTSVAELREGDEVVYTDQNGNEIPCIVLYDSTGSYGIQIISKDTVGSNIELGNGTGSSSYSTDPTHFATAKASYNQAIMKLNNAAIGYLNTNLATNARCVGSSPSETPVTSEDDTGTYTNTYSYFSSYNNQFKPASANNTSSTNEDWLQMKKSNINCYNISKVYWLASRDVVTDSEFTYFYVRYVGSFGAFFNLNLIRVFDSGNNYSLSIAYGLRPIFLLKSDIHYVEENGTKKLVQ